jgi:phosphatidylinositol 3-kinase
MNVEHRYFLSRDVSLDVRFKISLLDLTHSAEAFDASSTSEMSITAQIYADGLPMHAVPIRSHSPSQSKDSKIYWGEWMVLPVKYRDLSRNAQLVGSVCLAQ